MGMMAFLFMALSGYIIQQLKQMVLAGKITMEDYFNATERFILAQDEMIKAARELNAAQNEVIETKEEIISELEGHVKLLTKKDESHHAYIAHLHERVAKLSQENKKHASENLTIDELESPFDKWLN